MMLAEFLLARVAEDEAVAERLRRPSVGDPWGWQPNPHPLTTCGHGATQVHVNPARVLAECEIKRRVLDMGWATEDLEELTAVLALPYADHPDYREEWRP